MDLTSRSVESAAQFCRKHLEAGGGNETNTWYVGARHLYYEYQKWTHEIRVPPIEFNEMWIVLRLLFPDVSTARQAGHPVYTGIRYYRDRIGGHLEFGI